MLQNNEGKEMTEGRKEEIKQLLQEAMENLEIRQRSVNGSPLSPIGIQGYRDHLRQYWQSYSDTSLWVVRSYEPNIVNEDVKSKLLDFIREEFAQFIHEDRILSASFFIKGGILDGLSPGSSIDSLLDQLMKIIIARGIEKAVLDFDRGTEETHGLFQYLVLLEGIKIEREIQMFEGIRLLPLANSTSKLPYHLSSRSFSEPENFFSGKTLLVIDYFVSPIFHRPLQASTMQEHEEQMKSTFQTEIKSNDLPNFTMNDFPLSLLCQALSLACHAEFKISFINIFLPEDTLYNLSGGVGGGGSWHFHPPRNNKKADQPQIDEAKRLFGILNNLDSNTLRKLQIPINRWTKSKAYKDPEDKIIDLGIAFESLYLPKDNTDQLSFQFRLNASWHLGKGKADRKMLIDEFKAIYTLRSKAVHNGVVPEKIKVRKGEEPIATSEFIPRAQALCRDSIIKILEDGKFPDWNDLILGEISL